MEIELAVLLGLCVVGPAVFSVFEVETPAWRKLLKWSLVCVVTLLLTRVAGHWALAFPIGMALAGVAFHYWWCRKHGIHPLHATPRRRYYELRGWSWKE